MATHVSEKLFLMSPFVTNDDADGWHFKWKFHKKLWDKTEKVGKFGQMRIYNKKYFLVSISKIPHISLQQ